MVHPSKAKDNTELYQLRAIESGEPFLVVAYEDNLQWVHSEIEKFIEMWNEGKDITSIALRMQRPQHEVEYLIAYLASPRNLSDGQPLTLQTKKKFKRRCCQCQTQLHNII